MNATKTRSWVVYRMTVPGELQTFKAVCERSEWEAIDRLRPGYHVLLQDGIMTEGEAERLARAGTEAEAIPAKRGTFGSRATW